MAEEFETAGVCTGTWWSSSNDMLSSCFLQPSTEIALDTSGFDWQNIDILDAKTHNERHLDAYTFLGNANLDSTSQINVWNHSKELLDEEKFNPINSFLEGLFDSSEQLSVSDYVKPELLESFHFFDDVFLIKPEEDIQASKSLITCKRASEISQKVEDMESSPPLKRPRLETPLQFPSFKVRKEKLGDRITALQQLVSPFGKTDTASVLNDAIEYIKFLQEQISESSNPHLNSRGYGEQKQCSYKSDNNTHDLRSRGLCLMPISSTFSTSPPHLDASLFLELNCSVIAKEFKHCI